MSKPKIGESPRLSDLNMMGNCRPKNAVAVNNAIHNAPEKY
jgi:hypothetical protein